MERDPKIVGLSEFNAGWGAARDIADAIEIFKKLCDATVHKPLDENDLATYEKNWNAALHVIHDNLCCRRDQLRRISNSSF